jgi:hypothetical protein
MIPSEILHRTLKNSRTTGGVLVDTLAILGLLIAVSVVLFCANVIKIEGLNVPYDHTTNERLRR